MAESMDGTIRSTILRVLEILQRRRLLLIIPFSLMLPASFASAFLLSGGYAARSLVMLQETVASNPLAHDTTEPNADRMAQTLKGLRALLASDYVLAPVVENASDGPIDPLTKASRVKELARYVSVDLLGNDFLEFRLAGSSPKGLGKKLQIIMTNLIGALMAPPGETAGSFALRSLQEKIADADHQITLLDIRLSSVLPEGLDRAAAEVTKWTSIQAEIREELSRASGKFKTAESGRLPPGKASTHGGGLSNALRVSQTSLNEQLADISRKIDSLNKHVAEFKQAEAEKAIVVAAISSLRDRVKGERSRLGGEPTANWGAMINAPERMIVVDPPRDPELRTSSRFYFIVSGALGGILLGILLVILAEILDTTLRSADQVTSIAGFPCLGTLPVLSASGEEGGYAPSIPYEGSVSLPSSTQPPGKLKGP